MNAKLVNAAAGVIHGSQKNGRQTAAGIAADLESAQLLQSPETAAELAALKAERSDREDDLAAAVGYTSGLAWSDLVGIAATSTTSLIRAERDVRELRARVAEAVATVASQVQKITQLERIANAERARVAELEAAATTVYRAEHPDSGITLGHYGTAAAARAHCEATERRSWPTGTTLAFDWIEDDEDRVAELMVAAGQNEESTTGYLVTALELDSEYDEEAAE